MQSKPTDQSPAPLLPVSVCILTNRADKQLEKTLGAVSWAAERCLLVNTKADWAEWQKKYQLTIREYGTAPVTDFAAAKNTLLSLATQPWILVLDSDEVFELQAQQQRDLHLKLADASVTAYALPRIDVFHGHQLHWSDVRDVWLPRLFKKGCGSYMGAVHETLLLNGAVKKMPLPIQHYAHRDVASFWESITQYAQIQARTSQKHSYPRLLLELLILPPGKFVWNMLINLAWRDGWYGVVYAVLMSCHSALVRIFAWEMKRSSS